MIDLKYIQSVWDPSGPRNDIYYDPNGDIYTVENEDRLRQDMAKIVSTESGIMPYPNYGSILPSMVRNTRYSQAVLNSVADSVEASLRYVVQTETSANTRERLATVDTLDVSYTDSAISCNIKATTQYRSDLNLNLEVK